MQETSALSTVYDNEVYSGTFEGIITIIVETPRMQEPSALSTYKNRPFLNY
jgi:hypothetical protein